ncbi:hypothetical protein B0H14DRAFT_3079212 [Mycena olivaceomarginata]|nr:hypothetical protein B0H14DRAFT_3079212 [Mycena olivaceomarginata]
MAVKQHSGCSFECISYAAFLPFYSSSSRRSYNNQGYFRFLDDIPQNTVFWGIIGLNGTIERNPRLYAWMQKNFMANWRNISSWPHDLAHFFFNGFTFYFMAPFALNILGSRQFLFLYLGGGVIAQLGSTVYSNVFQRRDPYSLGASAAIYSTISFLAFATPRTTLLLYGIVPVPIWLAVGGIFMYDTYRTAADQGGTTNTSAHVGGLMAGAGYFFLRRFRIL